MTTSEVIWSVVIGLLTGGVSGALVSFFFERRAAEKEKQLRIAYEKQELYQYLLHVFDELVIIQNKRDVSRLIWIYSIIACPLLIYYEIYFLGI